MQVGQALAHVAPPTGKQLRSSRTPRNWISCRMYCWSESAPDVWQKPVARCGEVHATAKYVSRALLWGRPGSCRRST